MWLSIIGTLAGAGTLAVPGRAGSFLAIASGLAGAYLRTQTSTPIAGTTAASGKEVS
jgi:hypothetical protein